MSEEEKKYSFGFIEMIGSIILLILDPDRTNNKKYLSRKHYKANRIVGIITLIGITITVSYLITKHIL